MLSEDKDPTAQTARQVLALGAFAVTVSTKRHPVFQLSGVDLYHHFRNDALYDLYNLSLENMKPRFRFV